MKSLSIVFFVVMLLCAGASAQTTEFTYQGSLKNSGLPANGNFDFEFRLYDALTGGSQSGPMLSRTNVTVIDGIFAVRLDLGTTPFVGPDRYLEIRVRNSGGGGHTILDPRQRVGSSPFAVKSLLADTATSASTATNATTANNALQLGGVAAASYLQTNGNGAALTNLNATSISAGTLAVSRGGTGLTLPGASGNLLRSNGSAWVSSALSGSDVPQGSPNYIHNFTSPQAGANFNITGTGTANLFNSLSGYDIGGFRVLSTLGTGNVFAGVGAGTNTTGSSNAFFGRNAGSNMTTASQNSIFGSGAGGIGIGSDFNSFFGFEAGANTNRGPSGFGGKDNAFFGARAGRDNTDGSINAFFGADAGLSNTTGYRNAFFGQRAGSANTVGYGNAFFGADAGLSNTNGFFNAFFGDGAGRNTSGFGNVFIGPLAGQVNTTGNLNTIIGSGADVSSGNLSFATAIGSDAVVLASNTIALGRTDGSDRVRAYGNLTVNGTVTIGDLGTATSTNLCIGILGTLSACSSSIRYKNNVAPLKSGMDIVARLRPVTFFWNETNQKDFGLIAEEAEAVDPLLVTYNKDGQIQGVKYDQLNVVLVNAVKEQQAQIEKQLSLIEKHQALIEQLEKRLEQLEKKESR